MDVALSLAPKAHATARRTCPLRRSNESIPKAQNVTHSPTERETKGIGLIERGVRESHRPYLAQHVLFELKGYS